MDIELSPQDRQEITQAAGGVDLATLGHRLLDASDPDAILERARVTNPKPGEEDLKSAAAALAEEATAPLNEPKLRTLLVDARRRREQTLDIVSRDRLLEFAPANPESARDTAERFRDYLERHKDEIAALQILLNRPYARRHITYAEIKELAETLARENPRFDPGYLWTVYQRLTPERVHKKSPARVLTDLISLVRFAVDQEKELKPYPETVEERFEAWLRKQPGRFTEVQVEWLRLIKEHVATSLSVSEEDFGLTPFVERGGAFRAHKLFGKELQGMLQELVEVLAA